MFSNFKELFEQSFPEEAEKIRNIVKKQVRDLSEEFEDDEEERMFDITHEGLGFELDNRAVYRKLEAYLTGSQGLTWIKGFRATENGRDAFYAWADHYNGAGELSKRTELAKAKLKQLYYKNEQFYPFKTYITELSKCFTTLDKDPDEKNSGKQKVDALLKGIKTSDGELAGAKAYIAGTYPRDFAQACTHFSSQVSWLHGTAQLDRCNR